MLDAILLDQQSYWLDLIEKINQLKPNQSVYLVTMSLSFSEGYGVELFLAIKQALKRQVKFLILFDANNLMYQPEVFFHGKSFFNHLPSQLNQLSSLGAKIRILNLVSHYFPSPIKGRNHIKISIIDHFVYLGGCNLKDYHFIDSMIRLRNNDLYDQLVNFIEALYSEGSAKNVLDNDLELVLKGFNLLIDRGVKNQSIIYHQALTSINQALKRVIMTCQFLPDREILSALSDAISRGVDVRLYYNNVFNRYLPLSLIHFARYCYFKFNSTPSSLLSRRINRQKFLHAKILITDDQLLYGSHNFVKAGVKYGTAEIAIQTKNLKIMKSVIDFIKTFNNELN